MRTRQAPAPTAAVLALAALVFPLLADAQPAAAQAPVQATAPAASQARPPVPRASAAASRAGSKAVAAPKPLTHPLWRELAPGQQRALAPLAAHWDTLNEAQKRKWIALSANFPKMSGDEQAKLHSRMTEWVALSPQQRSIARLNFGETRQLAPEDKKAKWEAYQALSSDEKKKLAARAAKPPATAAALKPVSPDKLATVPTRPHQTASAKAPRIAAAPNQVDNRTLLPQPPHAGTN